jgi:hypothetical protein
MNREILFRGKHIHATPGNEHLNGTWVHGYLCDKDYIYDKVSRVNFWLMKIRFASIQDCMTRTAKEYGKTIS